MLCEIYKTRITLSVELDSSLSTPLWSVCAPDF